MKMKQVNKKLAALGVLLVLTVLPVFFHEDSYIMGVLTLCLIWGVVAQSWDLVTGYAGIFAFGQMSFFVVGGYVSGLLSVYLGVSPWLGLLAGGLAATFVGVLIGLPCLRLQGLYLGIVSFSVQFILPTIIVWAGPGRFENFHTGGTFGLQRIPPLAVLGLKFTPFDMVPSYYLALAFFILFMGAIYWVIHSPIGLAFMALRDAESMAKSLGVDDYKYKVLVFVISAFIGGVMGAFRAHYYGMMSPALVALDSFLLVIMMILIGGLGVYPGAAVGAFVIRIFNEIARGALLWRYVLLGGMVVVTMSFLPKGIMGLPELFGQIRRRAMQRFRREVPSD